MRVQIQLKITTEDGEVIDDGEVLALEKGCDRLDAIGLSLAEAKDLLSRLQQRTVEAQAAAYVAGRRCCAHCHRPLRSKGYCRLVFRTPFGNVPLASRRLRRCPCQPATGKTFSPLTELLTEHIAPELLYLETK